MNTARGFERASTIAEIPEVKRELTGLLSKEFMRT
jgi:hypothetical protein